MDRCDRPPMPAWSASAATARLESPLGEGAHGGNRLFPRATYLAVTAPGYDSPMAGELDKTPASAGILASEEIDVDALFARLQEEVRWGGSAPVDGDRSARLAWRNQAERMWPVSAERPIRRRPGPRGFVAYGVKR